MTAAASAGVLLPSAARKVFGATTRPSRPFPTAVFPEKRELIVVTDRPPQLETPLELFKHDLTPNDAFFVRWHLAGVPTSVDTKTFRLALGGHVDRPVSLSLDDLRKNFEPTSLVAVAQCSGNSRSFFEPRVLGGQWGNGAVGNAKWTGVRLRDLLAHAGVKDGAVEVTFAGLDRAPLPDMPQFVKSLTLDRAMHEDTLVAYEMNDAPLPMLNGFPLRLVVPGWFATYWVKALNQINVLDKPFDGFWMAKAYRIPKNPEVVESPQALATETIPIHRHTLRSILISPKQSQRIMKGKAVDIEGVALDDGTGIRKVEISTDGGKTWIDTTLGKDLGKYSWRRFHLQWTPPSPGDFSIMARATNSANQSQPTSQPWNKSGYQRNVIEKIDVNVA